MRTCSPGKRSATRGIPLTHQTHLGGDDAPAAGEAHPGLLLPANALAAFAGEFGAAHRVILAEGGDGGVPQRALRHTTITTFGEDYAVCSTEFTREGSERIGRQQQTWVRFPCGWRIVAAQVSLMS